VLVNNGRTSPEFTRTLKTESQSRIQRMTECGRNLGCRAGVASLRERE
jgi:hypothetical protein